MIVGVQLSSGNSAPNSANNHHLTIPFEFSMHSFKRQSACVSRNWRYESEPPLKPSPLTCETNSIIVLMFVESQKVTYRASVRYVTKTWSVVLLNNKTHILLSQVCCVWQVVKTQTIILNHPVYSVWLISFLISFCHTLPTHEHRACFRSHSHTSDLRVCVPPKLRSSQQKSGRVAIHTVLQCAVSHFSYVLLVLL